MMPPLVAALCASVCWGSAWFFSARVTRQVGSLNALFLFQLLGVPFLLLVFPFRPAWDTAPQWGVFLGLAAMCCGCMGMFFQSMRVGNLALVTPINQTAPVVTAMMGVVFLREPISTSQIGGIGFVLAGVLMLSLARAAGGRARLFAGVPLAIGASLAAGVYLFLCATTARHSGWYWTSLGIRLGMVLLLGAMVVPNMRRWWRPFPASFWRDAIAAAALDVTAFCLYNDTVSRTEVWYVAGVVTSQSLVTVVLAALFLREHLTRRQWMGLVMVLLGMAALQSRWGQDREAPQPTQGDESRATDLRVDARR